MEENQINEQQPIIEQKSSFKLTRGQKGTYGWEIKIYSDTIDEIIKNTIILNDWALKTYGEKITE